MGQNIYDLILIFFIKYTTKNKLPLNIRNTYSNIKLFPVKPEENFEQSTEKNTELSPFTSNDY